METVLPEATTIVSPQAGLEPQDQVLLASQLPVLVEVQVIEKLWAEKNKRGIINKGFLKNAL